MGDRLVRLHVDVPLAPGQELEIGHDQAHYLFNVMRLREGGELLLFNGRDGEWLARVVAKGRRDGRLEVVEHTRPQAAPAPLELLFAPLRKARTELVVEKAVELGATELRPVQTAFTNAERLREERLQARVVEAAEQCGRLDLPQLHALAPLGEVLESWPAHRPLLFCDEDVAGQGHGFDHLPESGHGFGVLVGPEGGFSPQERERIRALPFVHGVALGPRILRAETAAIAALALLQAWRGDWR